MHMFKIKSTKPYIQKMVLQEVQTEENYVVAVWKMERFFVVHLFEKVLFGQGFKDSNINLFYTVSLAILSHRKKILTKFLEMLLLCCWYFDCFEHSFLVFSGQLGPERETAEIKG